MTVVFIGLAVSIVVVVGIVSLAFCDVAFHPARPATVTGEAHPWRPPMIRGTDLFAWARNTANRLISDLLPGCRAAQVTADLAPEIRSGADFAMGLSPDAARQAWASDEMCYSMKSLTPLEVIEIAEFIRQTRPAPDVKSLADRASENSRRAERLDQTAYRQEGIRCPLLLDDGCCMVPGVEPLQCRAGCPLGVDEPSMKDDRPAALPNVDTHAMSVALGVERGMSEAIESAGLDGTVREFNGALAVALKTPDVAARWIHGDRMFEKCRQFE